MSEPSAFPWILICMDIWSALGWSTIIYLATLSGVSPELVEAAKIDGAGRIRVIWHIKLPHLRPMIIILLIQSAGQILSVGFERIYLLQNPLNLETANVISLYSYEVGMLQQRFSYSSAISLFNTVINFVLINVANKIAKKLTGISYI